MNAHIAKPVDMKLLITMINELKAVSYTHLDVYKRQTSSSEKKKINRSVPDRASHPVRKMLYKDYA